jgi:hypothetical protein
MLPSLSESRTAAPLRDGGRPLSRAAEAAALGISVRTLYRLRAAERAEAAESAGPEADSVPPPVPEPERPGRDALPYVELAEGPRPRLHYRLDADELSRLPGGPFRVGTGRCGWLQVAHRDDDRTVRDGDDGETPASEGRCVTDEDRAAGVVYVQAAAR